MIDPETALAFAVYEQKGTFALLVGSGLSRAAGIPTGWEVTLDLVRRVGLLKGVKNPSDWVEWYGSAFGKEPGYSDLLDQLSTSPMERRAILHRYIVATPEDLQQGRRTPTKAHRAIAQLVADGYIRIIITTNFDRLIESALRDAGVEPTVIASENDLKGAIPLSRMDCCVIKVHGDYLDTRIRNIEAELEKYPKAINSLLDRVLDEHGLIVCGWSGEWDSALRSAITRAPNRRYPLFWATRGEPSEDAKKLVSARGGRFVQIADAESFFDDLAEKVGLQADLTLPDPRSVELMVASAKKYVSNADHRIRLHDLIIQEVRCLGEIDLPVSNAMSNPTEAEFAKWLERLEGRLEPLARIFGILGRWGGAEEAEVALGIVRSYAERPTGGGLTHIVELPKYPAIVLSYAYGLGALAAGCLPAVHRLWTLPVTAPNSDLEPFVKHHFLEQWQSGRHGLWNLLTESSGQRFLAPLSEHLHSLFLGWSADYVISAQAFTALFDGFELLAGLEAMLLKADTDILTAAIADRSAHKWIWVPIGRAAWDTSVVPGLFSNWRSNEGLNSLATAPMAGGNRDLLKLGLQHLEHQIGRRRMFG